MNVVVALQRSLWGKEGPLILQAFFRVVLEQDAEGELAEEPMGAAEATPQFEGADTAEAAALVEVVDVDAGALAEMVAEEDDVDGDETPILLLEIDVDEEAGETAGADEMTAPRGLP